MEKKNYTKPEVEVLNFNVNEEVMTDLDKTPNVSGGVDEW